MELAQIGQLIINSFLVLVTIGLVIVTAFYTFSTHKMAKEMKHQSEIMQKEFELRTATIIDYPRIYPRTTGVMDPEIEVSVINKGYIVKFGYIYFRWWHREHPSDIETDIDEIGRWIEKGESISRTLKIDFSKIAHFRDASDVKGNGMVSIEFHFSDFQGKQFLYPPQEKIVLY